MNAGSEAGPLQTLNLFNVHNEDFQFHLAAGLAALAMLFVLPSMASADHDRRSQGHCSRCGSDIYANYVVVGYDRCRHPIYSWVPVAHRCQSYGYAPRPVYPRQGYYNGYSGYNGGYNGYNRSNGGCRNGSSYGGGYYGRPVCPPSRGGFSITFGF